MVESMTVPELASYGL